MRQISITRMPRSAVTNQQTLEIMALRKRIKELTERLDAVAALEPDDLSGEFWAVELTIRATVSAANVDEAYGRVVKRLASIGATPVGAAHVVHHIAGEDGLPLEG